MRIGKEYFFEAAHLLSNHIGKCSRLHGHSYKVEVVLEGGAHGNSGDSNEGMLLDFEHLNKAMHPIIESLDHYYLNDVIKNDVTTAENIALYIAKWLYSNLNQIKEWVELDNARVLSVRVWEGRKAYAEWSNG